MTKLCSAFFKYENNLKIGREKYRTVLKCTQMRARVEKVDVLGWNKSVDTFSHAPNLQRENARVIFTSDNIYKSYKLVDAVKNLTINDDKYYESNTSTASDTQGDLTCNPETVTHTRNRKFEQYY